MVRGAVCANAVKGCDPVTQATNQGMINHAAQPCTNQADSQAQSRTRFSGT